MTDADWGVALEGALEYYCRNLFTWENDTCSLVCVSCERFIPPWCALACLPDKTFTDPGVIALTAKLVLSIGLVHILLRHPAVWGANRQTHVEEALAREQQYIRLAGLSWALVEAQALIMGPS